MQSGEENEMKNKMKNSLHQTAFLNAPQSERIFPKSVGNVAVRNPYLMVYTQCVVNEVCDDPLEVLKSIKANPDNYQQLPKGRQWNKSLQRSGSRAHLISVGACTRMLYSCYSFYLSSQQYFCTTLCAYNHISIVRYVLYFNRICQ